DRGGLRVLGLQDREQLGRVQLAHEAERLVATGGGRLGQQLAGLLSTQRAGQQVAGVVGATGGDELPAHRVLVRRLQARGPPPCRAFPPKRLTRVPSPSGKRAG